MEMLRITMSVSGEGATKYFDAALATSKYYGSERGQWGGKGAELLGLRGNASLQEVARGKIVWIDEAGFLSTRQMRWAVDFAVRNDCRLIFSGDTRQHHAVERGDAMRLMEQTGAVAH